MSSIEDKTYCNSIDKCYRQRSKIRELMEYVDQKKDQLFIQHVTPSGNF